MQAYSDPDRAADPHALPDVEVFYLTAGEMVRDPDEADPYDHYYEKGWYYWACFPGCLPDGEPEGPFGSEVEALADAQGGER